MMTRTPRPLVLASAVLGLTLATSTRGGVFPFGGLTYSTSIGGYTQQSPGYHGNAGGNRGGVGSAQKFDTLGTYRGTRAVRLSIDDIGAELGVLGTDNFLTTSSQAAGANAAGTSVGYATKWASGADKGRRGVRWDAGTTTAVELGVLGSPASGVSTAEALAVNDAGVVVGYSQKYAPGFKGSRATRWAAGSTTATELNGLNLNAAATADSFATAIANSGIAAGWSEKIDGNGANQGRRAVRWAANSTTATELGTLGTTLLGFGHAEPNAVNDAGTVVGVADRYDAATLTGERAVRWASNGNAATELTAPAPDAGYALVSSEANDVSPTGTVVGGAQYKLNVGTQTYGPALRWSANSTTAVVLGTIPVSAGNRPEAVARAVNAFDVAVGLQIESRPDGAAQNFQAVLWAADGTATNLNGLLTAEQKSHWYLGDAEAISDTGIVYGEAWFDADGNGNEPAYRRVFGLVVPSAGTYGRGDANFDTAVNFADLLLLAQHYGQPSAGSVHAADLNLDGTTDFADLLALAQHYGSSVTGTFAGDWSLAQASVPEPTAIATVAIAGVVALKRRRRA